LSSFSGDREKTVARWEKAVCHPAIDPEKPAGANSASGSISSLLTLFGTANRLS
jgi:hypothetical protein